MASPAPAPSAQSLAVLRAIARAHFNRAATQTLCATTGWPLRDHDPLDSFLAFAIPLTSGTAEQSTLTVLTAPENRAPFVFVPLFFFEEYGHTRAPFDTAFHSITSHLAGILGPATRAADYHYPHRPDWPYRFTGWALPDATLTLVQDEFDIQFGMDITLWLHPTGTPVEAPVKYS